MALLQFKKDQIANGAIDQTKIENACITASQMNLTGSFAFNGGITSTVVPASDSDLANKLYVDSIASGLHWKDSVKAATTADITLSGTQTVDGVALSADDRCLVKNQDTASENGIYVVKAGAWERATDMDANDEFSGAALFCQQGTSQADTGWVCSNDGTVNMGTTAITFVQFSGNGSVTGGAGITVTGNSVAIDLKDTGSGLAFDGGELEIDAGGVTNAMLAGSIATSKLLSDTITITAGSGLSGGGTPALGGSTSLAVSGVTNAMIDAAAAIADSKLATIATPDKVSGSAIQLGSNPGLQDSTGLKLKVEASKGLEVGANGLAIDLDGSTLALGADGIKVNTIGAANIAANAGIEDSKLATIATANKVSGSAVQLASSNPTLEDATGLQLKIKSNSGLEATPNGVALKLDGNGLTMGAAGLKIAVVEQADMGYQPRKEGFTGDGSWDSKNLSFRILSPDWRDGLVVTRNGQVLDQVNSGPSDYEYTCSDNGSATSITFGTEPLAGDVIRVMYFA